MTIAAPATIRETVRVGLGERAYDVVIGPDLFADLGPLLDPVMKRDRTVIVTDDQVAPHHLGEEIVHAVVAHGWHVGNSV